MNTKRMIADIKAVCSDLESKRNDLMAQVKAIDDELTGYRMAIDALELTVSSKSAPVIAEQDASRSKTTKRLGNGAILELNGVKHTVSEWAKALGMTPQGINYRLASGWSIEKTLSTPGQYNRKKGGQKSRKVFAYDAHNNIIRQYFGVSDVAKDLHLPVSTVESIIMNVPKQDQIRVRNYYLAYAT